MVVERSCTPLTEGEKKVYSKRKGEKEFIAVTLFYVYSGSPYTVNKQINFALGKQ